MKAPRSGVNRRDLLRLRKVASSHSEAGERHARLPENESSQPTDLLRVHRPAMGSYFEIRLGVKIPGALTLATRALDLIDELEQQLTIYDDESEVSRLNRAAHQRPVAVEPRLFDLLRRACALSERTGGAYDVTSGALSEAWGFVRGPKRVPDPDVLKLARERTGFRHLRLDHEAKTIQFDREGLRINLGSIGKGYAIDRAVDLIRGYWFPTSALIHGGQSSLYALGSPPGFFGGRWEVAVRNPLNPEHPLGVLRLRNRGLGTSGSAFQSFVVDGRVYGHLLDPRTGEPAEGPASVTVLAPSAADADALSTAVYLLGADAARDFAAANPELGILIVEAGSADRPPRLRLFGLKPEDFLIDPNAVDLLSTS